MNTISFHIDYEWAPFTVNNDHLIYYEYEKGIRLDQQDCSHWGSAIYKWEGTLTAGENKGKTGILIGETGDIRSRLNQYKSGTQENGNKYWREEFLRRGKIYYWVMNLEKCVLNDEKIDHQQIGSKNFRLVLEQLLVMDLLSKYDQTKTWVVNKMQ